MTARARPLDAIALIPPRPRISENAPRCEALVHSGGTVAWRRKMYQDPETCQFPAHFEIDGVKLCSRHAGAVALNILLAEGKRAR